MDFARRETTRLDELRWAATKRRVDLQLLLGSGIPLATSAAVVADVTSPAGVTQRVHLQPRGDSYRATITTTGAGTYHVHVQAAGSDLRGVAFTREALRSLAVWSRGDDPPPTTIDPAGPWHRLVRPVALPARNRRRPSRIAAP